MTPHYDADIAAEDKDQNYTAALLHIASDADYCHHVLWSLCLSVCLTLQWVPQNGWTGWDTIWHVDLGWAKEPCIRWGPSHTMGRGNSGDILGHAQMCRCSQHTQHTWHYSQSSSNCMPTVNKLNIIHYRAVAVQPHATCTVATWYWPGFKGRSSKLLVSGNGLLSTVLLFCNPIATINHMSQGSKMHTVHSSTTPRITFTDKQLIHATDNLEQGHFNI